MSPEAVIQAQAAPSADAAHLHLPEPFVLVLFGATGDLAARKIFPALFNLERKKLLPDRCAVLGVGRREKSDDAFRDEVRRALAEFGAQAAPGQAAPGQATPFLQRIFYQAADVSQDGGLTALPQRLELLEKESGLPGNRLFYLAIDPDLFPATIEALSRAGLSHPPRPATWLRVVLEKPFGHDLPSALALDRQAHKHLQPDQIYRIDHYLGKDTVQNLLAFRFGNAIFEPVFNRRYVDHIQITAAETVGMEGRRGAFYDGAGALRDVVQNHMLQLVALIAADPPATLKARDLKDAKLRVLRDLRPLEGEEVARHVVRGQYGPGAIKGVPVRGYREEGGVAADSNTETYVALRLELESWRWAGVPFLLRAGKRLARRVTEIAVQFKLPPLKLFRTVECVGDDCDLTAARPNVLVFRIQPDEGIFLSFAAKRPGMGLDLQPVRFEFDYDHAFARPLGDAYERLLFDALRGDASLFMRSDELEAAWEFITPILDAWSAAPPPSFPNYAAGSQGPAEARRLADGCNVGWRSLEPDRPNAAP
jgi:glucose-6-phosphate 1-dehydrogenase